MHRLLFISLLCIAVAGCDAGESTGERYEQEAEEFFDKSSDSVVVADDPFSGIQAWQGNLDGKYPVLMWYKEINGVLQGSLFYTDQKRSEPIRLVGSSVNGEHRLTEYLPNGNISGFWQLTPTRNSIEGEWVHPTSDKRLSVSLIDIDTAVVVEGLKPGADVSGEYRYDINKLDGPSGYMSVTQSGDKIVVNFDNVTGAPAHNMARIENDTLTLDNHTAVHYSTDYGACKFRIRFYDGFAVVDYLEDMVDCGFGHNAYVSGTYIRM